LHFTKTYRRSTSPTPALDSTAIPPPSSVLLGLLKLYPENEKIRESETTGPRGARDDEV